MKRFAFILVTLFPFVALAGLSNGQGWIRLGNTPALSYPTPTATPTPALPTPTPTPTPSPTPTASATPTPTAAPTPPIGTLQRAWIDGIDSRIAAKDPSAAAAMFTTGTTANSSFWASDIDLSCIGLGEPARGCLISPRHILTANHYFPGGSPFSPITETFRKPDGTLITRTVTNMVNGGADCYVGILDSDVPAGVTFATVFPDSFTQKASSGLLGLPAMQTNQDHKAGVAEVSEPTFTAGSYIGFRNPAQANRQPWALSIIIGDSGRPAFAIINGHVVLLCTWNYGGYGAGPFTTEFISSINAAMHTLSVQASATTDYKLTTEDLSGFADY